TGSFFFQGGLSNSLVNSGTFTLNSDVNLSLGLVNSGTLNVNSRTLNVTPTWANTGTILLTGGVIAGGNLTNTATGNLTGFGALSNLVANLGAINVTNGTLTVLNLATQSGTVNILTSGTMQVSGALTNSGNFTINA